MRRGSCRGCVVLPAGLSVVVLVGDVGSRRIVRRWGSSWRSGVRVCCKAWIRLERAKRIVDIPGFFSAADTGRRLLCNGFGHAPRRAMGPGGPGCSPCVAAGARTGVRMGPACVLQALQSRAAGLRAVGPRRWPVRPGVETTSDAVLRRSVLLKPAVMQPLCGARSPLRTAGLWGPECSGARTASSSWATGSMRSYAVLPGRT